MPTRTVIGKSAEWVQHGQRLRHVLREALVNFFTQDSLMVSASIAYHGLLAIFPLMLLLLGLTGIFIRRLELGGQLAVVLERYLPMKPDFILQNLVGISRAYGRVGVISFILLLWSSSGVFLPLEKALNNAWEVEKGRRWWRSRLLALEMAAILGFLILISSALVGANVYFHNWMRQHVFHRASWVFEFTYHLSITAGTFGVSLGMFVVLFQRLPNRPMRLRQAFPSALLTATLWEAARFLFAFLLPVFNYRHVYGSIGAVVALMTWAYISSAVMLFGAEVSRSLYRTIKIAAALEAAPSAPPASPVHSGGDAR